MIYAAFTLWLFLILFAGSGVQRLLGRMAPRQWLDWALLPGTVVSEMAYIFGCLITGGEIRRARLMPGKAGSKAKVSQSTTEAAGGLKIMGPIIASLLAICACGAAILLCGKVLGQPIIRKLVATSPEVLMPQLLLPKELPASADAFWGHMETQLRLLRRMLETWGRLDWLDWRVGVFVYLTGCFAIRIAPVGRSIRATLAAAVVIAVLISVAGLISRGFSNIMSDIWPLLTYVWASLLSFLVVMLLLSGLAHLGRIVLGKEK